MKNLTLTILMLPFASLQCPAQKKAERQKICITEEEQEIYRVSGVTNFQEETIVGGLFEQAEAGLPGVAPETLASYRERNGSAYLLRCVDRPGGRTAKLKKYSGGNASTYFSRIGFGREGKEALVYSAWAAVGNYCGAEFILLRKNADKWEIVKRLMTHIC